MIQDNINLKETTAGASLNWLTFSTVYNSVNPEDQIAWSN